MRKSIVWWSVGLVIGLVGGWWIADLGRASKNSNTSAQPKDERASVLGQTARPNALNALPYVDGTFDPEAAQQGVLLHEPEAVWAGLNFYCSRELRAAVLLDMAGKVVHRWRISLGGLDHCELLPNGDVLALSQDRAVVRVDAASKVIWTYRDEVHHSFWHHDNGEIYVLVRRKVARPDLHPEHPAYDDRIVVLSAEGAPLREISLLSAVERSPFSFLMTSVYDREIDTRLEASQPILDLLHSNQVQVFDGRLAERSPLLARGNLLVSLRNVSTIAILDPTGQDILWLWGPSNLAFQHQPTLLENGRILLFDNGTQTSQLLEVDPLTRRIAWRYEDGKNFFSATRGSCQRLPNGNTLVTESNRGYVFEITPAGKRVWVWANPVVLEGNKRAFVWRMNRYAAEGLDFLRAKAAPSG